MCRHHHHHHHHHLLDFKARYSSSWESVSELRGVTCHMGSHSVTCHPIQVNAPRHNPSQTGRYSIYLPRRDGRLSRPIGSPIAAWPGVEPYRSSKSRGKGPGGDLSGGICPRGMSRGECPTLRPLDRKVRRPNHGIQ